MWIGRVDAVVCFCEFMVVRDGKEGKGEIVIPSIMTRG